MDACGCDSFTDIFDEGTARDDIERYRSEGPDGTTRLLLDMIRSAGVADATLLDIGAGVGVIDHELLADGVRRAVLVDGSPAYESAARDEAAARGTVDRMSYVVGDFVHVADRVEAADVVTLDRVVCCYPSVDALVRASIRKATRLYGLVLPRDRVVIRIGLGLLNVWYRLRGRAYRAFVHPNARVDALAAEAGFRPTAEATTLAWRVVLYARAA
jgi:magnesium-protoporphyrin O-methyltransferase